MLKSPGRTSFETGDEEYNSDIDKISKRLAYSKYENDPLCTKHFRFARDNSSKHRYPFDMNEWKSRLRRGFLRTNIMSKLTILAHMNRTEDLLKVGLTERAWEEKSDALYLKV